MGDYVWNERWRKLSPGELLSTEELRERVNYCVHWRVWLWKAAALRVLEPFQQFRDKRVLELGPKWGRMSCLLAAAGARVDAYDVSDKAMDAAREEARRWGVEDRTLFRTYSGDASELPKATYDFVFSKSVLVIMDKDALPSNIQQLHACLRMGGRGLFIENHRNVLINVIRRYWIHRYATDYFDSRYWGFNRKDIDTHLDIFKPLDMKRHRGLVWSIRTGLKS